MDQSENNSRSAATQPEGKKPYSSPFIQRLGAEQKTDGKGEFEFEYTTPTTGVKFGPS